MTPRRRVAFAVDSASYGGAEQCVVQLVRGLPPDVATAVVATEPVPEPLAAAALAAGVPVRSTPAVRGRAGGADEVAAALAATRPDLVHVNFVDPVTCVELLEGALATGAAVVVDVHMTGALAGPAAAGGQLRRLRAAYGAVAAVVARSREVGRAVATTFDVPESRVHVVRNGVPVRPRAPRRPRRTGRPLRVRSVGRLTWQKGYDVLADAVRAVADDGIALDVAVAGTGREHDALVARAAGLPLRFAGFTADVPAFLADADVFCLPSRAEALPLALLEAVVAGLPCVATDVGDVGTAVGDVAVVVPPDDPGALAAALTALASDDRRRARLAARARRVGVARFDERRTVAAVDAVYRAALEAAPAIP